MFENLLYQNASATLKADIKNDTLPHSLLFSGPSSSGKLTAALELARVLSCQGADRGAWNCTCASCLKHKALDCLDLIVAGPRDCSLEIKAAAETFITAVQEKAQYMAATRYLFIRSVRKLTVRFSPILYEGDDKASKIAPVLEAIDADLEEMHPSRDLPRDQKDVEKLTKLVESIVKNCVKLEESFMYDSIPVNQIRAISSWAHYTSEGRRKVVILENTDRMEESARNALLKTLEEPPDNTIIILTTTNRGAVMQTILSRVRMYTFSDRTVQQQQEVLYRVFHDPSYQTHHSVEGFLTLYLPVPSDEIHKAAYDYANQLFRGIRPDTDALLSRVKNFEPRISYRIFFEALFQYMKDMLTAASASPEQLAATSGLVCRAIEAIQDAYESVTVYNVTPAAALEVLYERVR